MSYAIAVIYARFSPRPDAEESDSNEKQIERAREYCKQKGYTVRQELIFTDEALTGLDHEEDPDAAKCILKRPGLRAALDAVKKGMVLVVRWRNRIARDPYIRAWTRRTVMKKGGRIEATDESNAEGFEGEMLDNILATVDKYRAIQIGIDTAVAMRKHQASGRRMGRVDRVPFGFKVSRNNDRVLIPDYEERRIIKRIFELHHRNGKGLHAICTQLDREKLWRRGKTWKKAHKQIARILDRYPVEEILKDAPFGHDSDDTTNEARDSANPIPLVTQEIATQAVTQFDLSTLE